MYDDGEDYTIVGYKMMADAVARKWRERDPPAQKPRAPPRYEPMVRATHALLCVVSLSLVDNDGVVSPCWFLPRIFRMYLCISVVLVTLPASSE